MSLAAAEVLDQRWTGFDELVIGLCWKPEETVAMLWAYFDESGEYDPTSGYLSSLTIGGLIGTVWQWQRLDKQWAAALERAGIAEFHRKNVSHSGLIDELYRIIAGNVRNVFGFTTRVIEANPRKQHSSTYEASLVDCLMEVASVSSKTVDKISIMFAKHPEYGRQKRFFDLIDYGDARLGRLALGDPSDTNPLQAADLVAHDLRPQGSLARLKQLGCNIHRFENGRLVRREA
jgi:hypothetical protein